MTITVELDDKEITEAAKQLVIERVASQIMDDGKGGGLRYCYRTVIKECVREAIKKDINNLSDRAVAAASKSIENKAVKKLMEKILEGEN